MTDFAFLQSFFEEHYKPDARYLQELHNEAESSQAEGLQQKRRL